MCHAGPYDISSGMTTNVTLVRDGGIATVRSRRGEIRLPVQVTDKIERGHVFTTFHFPESRTNLLVGSSSDVNTSCPEYKVVAVTVEQSGAQTPDSLEADAVPA